MTNDQMLQLFRTGSAGTLLERMEIEITEVDRDRVVATMPVAGNTQPYGLLHGGASAVLAETLGSIAAAVNAGPDRVVVGIGLHCTHHRAARSGLVTGVATPIHRGGTLQTWQIVISDDADRRICTAELTCIVRDAPPGS